MSAERVFGLQARFFVFSGLDLARAAALQKYREGKGMKRKLAAVLPALVMALLLGLSVFFVACDSGTESGGQNTEQSGEEQEGTEQGGGNEGETGGETGDGGETGEEGDGDGETGGEDPAPVPDVSDKLVFTLNDEETAYSVTDMDKSAAGSVTIPSTYNGLPVVYISPNVFRDCINIIEIKISEGVTSIEFSTFYNCKGLTEITIPASVTSIDSYAFPGCKSLTGINVAEGNTVYHSEGNCLIETTTKTLILGCQNSVIPTDGSVTSIGSYAFNGCSGLTEITIPEGVTGIGESAFEYCSSLTEITIPAGVRSIGAAAFWECSSLSEITIPASVTSIGSHAFYACTSLTEITIPAGVTGIDGGMFSGCSSLTKITIPAGVTSIGYGSFYHCSSLTSVIFETTEGWWYASSSTATSGTEIASSDLANPATAATYLTSTYDDYYWHRS